MNIHQFAVFTSKSFKIIRRFPTINLSCDREDFLLVRYSLVIFGNDVAKFDCWVLILLNLMEFRDVLNIIGIQLPQVSLCWWHILHADSETSDPSPLPQVTLCCWTVEHLFANLEDSLLRRDWNFDLWLHQSLSDNTSCRLEALSIPGLLDAVVLSTDEELAATELVRFITIGLDFATILFSSDCSCILLPSLACWPSWDSWRSKEIWNGWCWTNKEDYSIRHVWSVLCQYVCHLVFGVSVPDLNLGVQGNSVKRNSVSPWHMSHGWNPALDYHLDHGFIVLKPRTTSQWTEKFWRSKAHYQCEIIETYGACLELWFGSSFVCSSWRDATSFTVLIILGFTGLLLVAMKHFYYQIPRSRAGLPPIRKPRQEKLSQLLLNYEKLKSVSCTSNFLARRNNPNLNCCAVFPTWQCCLNSLVSWMSEIKRAEQLSPALVDFEMARASLFTEHKKSGLPIRVKYKHFRIIWAHSSDNSPTEPISSSLNWWSSIHGVATLCNCWIDLFARSQNLSTQLFAWPSIS